MRDPLPAAEPGPLYTAPVERIYRVRELNAELRQHLESSYPTIWLEGEVSNFRCFSASGHWYFTLKDTTAQIAAAMFRSRNRLLRFQPEDGMHVLVRGQISLYEPRGTYQIIVSRVEPRGAGALHVAFEQLKTRLEAEGLFDSDRKQPLPTLPRRVGIITSADGAAVRDILRVLRQGRSGVSALLIPTRVQGEKAAEEIAAAIALASQHSDLDVLIVGRGGGSLEDLWAFNEETVARAIAACTLPVISAVGHEVDVTIADLVADCRAPTPSAAAEILVRSRTEVLTHLRSLSQRLGGAMELVLMRLRAGLAGQFRVRAAHYLETRLRRSVQRLDELTGRLREAGHHLVASRRRRLDPLAGRLSPAALREVAARRRERFGDMQRRLSAAVRLRLRESHQILEALASRLRALSPLSILERGYSLASLPESGAVLRDASQAPPGTAVDLLLFRGRLQTQVVRSSTGKRPDRSGPRRRSVGKTSKD